MVYLDSAATTKPVSSIIEAIKPYIETDWFNPSVLYSKGKKVKEKIESVRCRVAKEIGALSYEVFFTSGASESNNWVIRGFIDQCKVKGIQPVIITTQIEHKSILECVNQICSIENLDYEYVPINSYGQVDIDKLEELLEQYRIADDGTGRTKVLVSIGMANSEIGTIQDIETIAKIVHRFNGIIHTDATQAFGHIPINVSDSNIDLLTASAQKLGGLKGIGFLFKREGIKIKPLIYGSQEQGERGGTENVVGIIALNEAIKYINYDFEKSTISSMRDYMIEKMVDTFKCHVNGDKNNRLPNNINVTFPQAITGEALIYLLDMCNIYISSGSACNSHSTKPSSTLQAIGLTNEEISRTIRITLPEDIDKNQIDSCINEIDRQITLLTNV